MIANEKILKNRQNEIELNNSCHHKAITNEQIS